MFFVMALCLITSCKSSKLSNRALLPDAYNVGLLIMDGVYNTELTAPMDIFQHTQYREGIKAMNVFTVAKSDKPVESFEGLKIIPDYTFQNVPNIDILVVPSAEHHLDSDLEDTEMISWVRRIGQKAEWVTSHCDGAFVLAQAGLLDGVASTTFPSDIEAYKKRFPQLEVVSDVLFVHDGKFITSAGGAKSFEAALYLCEHLYGAELARRLAKGLVIEWKLEGLRYEIREKQSK